ncbi:MAG: hypothetical protein A2677_03195 [Candidatus Komeilibacteria bacterium RIFCSPHIGHO2_01_FULL_52_14]|uniref:Uncharacterized protein n=1 Tax=Candidatus Komeilibacteria bacterium RIFCSPHIGHO2_01_FULL_52_14 TaxID=1798549 RepID=A0A1G2BQ53_9BACT|nr:MAG: hypothetical protein A2677_03195 [Candidatus Komeilibacteria bacterium RIFCSPHIGHO2_01_FULL_52_14]
MHRNLKKLIVVFFVGGSAFFAYLFLQKEPATNPTGRQAQAQETVRHETTRIEPGDTFSLLAQEAGLDASTTSALLNSAQPVYDLATIKAGKSILFSFDRETGTLQKMIYEPTTEKALTIVSTGGGWEASLAPIQYDVRTRTVSGTIDSSLYETGLAQNIDERAIIALADMFAWQVDFAVDIRKGDSFTMLYEERYRDGQYMMPGSVLAASFTNDGEKFLGYSYTESDGHTGYFDPDGNSLEKILLKSPLQYRYISSGYTGARIDPISGHTAPHRAIDYAAAYGTPAVTVGDGTVIRSGWYGGYGLSVDVRHNDQYITRYGHFSRIAVKTGQKVTQGQIVGYVGSTGHSTGPHLHFELHKYGTPINPLTVELPSDKAISAAELDAYKAYSANLHFE